MRILWTLIKIIVVLAVAIPLGVFVMATMLGLAVMALRLACIGLVAYGMYRLARFFFAPVAGPPPQLAPAMPARDPYYDAAMRELDRELGTNPTR